MAFENCFKGKVILVTGAGRGIGRAVSLKLDSLGATVWAVSKNPQNLATLKSNSERIQTIAVDLSDWPKTREAIGNIPVVFDCLLNNAGICPMASFMETTPEGFDSICNVNLKAVFNVSQVVARKMMEAGKSGSIVNVSSIGGLKPTPMVAAYSTLKAGLDHLTKIMAIELGPKNIRVNAVSPGAVYTDLIEPFLTQLDQKPDPNYVNRIPLRRPLAEMDEVVNSILFYLSDLVPIVTGTVLQVDGGLSVN